MTATTASGMGDRVKPNNRLHLTAKPLRALVPSGLRPPAAGEPKR